MSNHVPQPAAEAVPVVANADGSTLRAVLVSPTQVRRPWRTTVRTIFQLAMALVTLIPFIVTGVYGDGDNVPALVTQVLVVDAAIARVMALPQVEAFLRRFAPWLSAAPKA